ncbi:hypothetical protein MSG28_005839 [Choristoneura fumiferana]|uniref:Uncharacterized protein n=1 Tax=Choristoneura fumiferana TaxID=7141 RepID=A0ACC0L0J6_CHOFU|nr:hypothetical protein MSG28_005839 [Choristoneura fumiferana]
MPRLARIGNYPIPFSEQAYTRIRDKVADDKVHYQIILIGLKEMIRKIKLFILGALLTLSSGGVTNDSRDGFSSEEQGTLKRSYRQHPLIDTLLQSVNPKYEPKQPDDFFDFLRDQYPLPDGLKSPLSEYDYIIVGAGSAGCTLAARLTEDPKTTVLLLEAGKGEMFTTDAPAIAAFFQRTDYTWQYFMEKEPGVCLGHMMKFLNTTRNLSGQV